MVPTTIRKEAPTGNVPIGVNLLQAVTNHYPQAGGNRVTEAPEVISDITKGDECMETLFPNDSIASPSPIVGHLHSVRRDWQTQKRVDNKSREV